MKHVVSKPREPFLIAGGQLEVHQIPSFQDNLIWLIVDVEPNEAGLREAAAVDGPHAQEVLDYVEAHKFHLTTIFNTHTHFDHIGINKDLEGRGQLKDLRVIGPERAKDAVPGITEAVDEGDSVEFAGVKGRVMLTEGHINGHVSYVFDGAVFCGDTLFAGGCGYLFDGPPAAMQDSLARLGELPEDTWVCCAHEYTEDNLHFAWSVEPENAALAERIQRVWALRARGECAVPSTIGVERATNPFLRWDSAELCRLVGESIPLGDGSPAAVFGATRALKDKKLYRDAPRPFA